MSIETILLEKGGHLIDTLPNVSIRQAVHKMVEATASCLLVEHENSILGIFTERDLLRRVVARDMDIDTTPIEQVMSSPVDTCKPSDNIADVADHLFAKNYQHMVVVDGEGLPVGVVCLRDIAQAIRKRL